MINTRNPAVLGMTCVGIALLVIAGVFQFFVKPPDVKAALAQQERDRTKYLSDVTKNKASTATEVAKIQTRLWSEPDDKIAPEALSRVNALAKKHGVKMTTFRPQKDVVAGALSILPFFVSVEGPFPAVFDFVKDLEQNEGLLLIVNLVQLSANDQSSHNVTASIGLSAYIDPNRGIVSNVKTSAASPADLTPSSTDQASRKDASVAPKKTAATGGKS